MNLLNLENDKFKTVKVKGYQFKIKFISPLDRVQITQGRMLLQGGNPVESLTNADYIFFENIAMVNVCTEEMPEQFNENESCINWQDIELINALAQEIKDHTASTEGKLKKNKPVTGGEEA